MESFGACCCFGTSRAYRAFDNFASISGMLSRWLRDSPQASFQLRNDLGNDLSAFATYYTAADLVAGLYAYAKQDIRFSSMLRKWYFPCLSMVLESVGTDVECRSESYCSEGIV